MTERMLRAVESPHTDILGHCTGRILAGQGPAAVAPSTPRPSSSRARDRHGGRDQLPTRAPRPTRGVARPGALARLHVVVDTDAHAPGQLEWQRHGCEQAARVGVPAERVMNTLPMDEFLAWTAGHACLSPPPSAAGYDEPVALPVVPPVAPMLAKLARELPEGDGLFYEPKWDGFRCIVFRDGDDVVLGSRNEKPLTRYFPELSSRCGPTFPTGAFSTARSYRRPGRPRLRRVVPADPSRRLPGQAAGRTTPASFVAFDLLALGDDDLQGEPYPARRGPRGGAARPRTPVHLTPVTTEPDVARDWFSRFEGAGLDGVVVKAGDLPYQPDKRVMMKVKHERTADCVVGGFRWHKDGRRSSARSSSASSTTRACSTTSGSRPGSAPPGERSSSRRSSPIGGRQPRRAPVARRGRRRRTGPRGPEPLERGQGPQLGAAPTRAGGRGRLRPPPGRPVPPRHVVRPLATRPDAGILHLRPARHPGTDRAREVFGTRG